ncbi:MAG: FAD-dependent oxidoreductase, partial [Pseudomonadota bacterium]
PHHSPIGQRKAAQHHGAVMGSMHTGLEEQPTLDRLAAFYAERARGGVDLIVTGGIAPNGEGAVYPGAASMTCEADAQKHRVVTQAVHDHGGHICMQILHAGRYAFGKDAVAPSAIRAPISPITPRALETDEIETQIADFARAARLAVEAGYDGVEVMGSEGYLINQFMAARTNQRDDDWGGDAARRRRFGVEVVRAVRDAMGDDPVLIFRLSMLDLVDGGSPWTDVVSMAKEVERAGATAINTGIGWHEARIPTIATSVPRGAFTWVTEKMVGEVSVPLITSNRINTPEVAEAALADTGIAMVSMARPFLADADFMSKARDDQSARITPCIACNQACLDHTFELKTATCIVNPRAGHETELIIAPAQLPKSIAVVGAGPAGLSAALTASQRGHRVTLFEAGDQLGGLMQLAARVPGKEEFIPLLAWFKAEIQASDIAVRLNTTAMPEDLDEFDEVIVATGTTPRDPGIQGQSAAHVQGFEAALATPAKPGERVAIVGAGGIGFDVATYLTADVEPAEDVQSWSASWGIGDPRDHKAGLTGTSPDQKSDVEVTLMQRRAGGLGKRLGRTTGWIHRSTLRKRGVTMMGGVRYDEITPQGLRVTVNDTEELLIKADRIILCAGQVSRRDLADALVAKGRTVHVIGGADKAAELDAKRAINQGTRLAATL